MEQNKTKPKLEKLLKSGYEWTGKKYKILRGQHKGKEFPVYAMKGDIAGIVYNEEEDKIELVYNLLKPYQGREI